MNRKGLCILLFSLVGVMQSWAQVPGELPYRTVLPFLDYTASDSACIKGLDSDYQSSAIYKEDTCTYRRFYGLSNCEKLDYLDTLFAIYYYSRSNVIYYSSGADVPTAGAIVEKRGWAFMLPSFINFSENKLTYDFINKYGAGPYSGCKVFGFVDNPNPGICTILLRADSTNTEDYSRFQELIRMDSNIDKGVDNAPLTLIEKTKLQLNYWREKAGCGASNLDTKAEPSGTYTNVAKFAKREDAALLEMLENEIGIRAKKRSLYFYKVLEFKALYKHMLKYIVCKHFGLAFVPEK